ncbi:hypothetical protein Psta_1695 [Pirellula staleyi DSM 6068]|uniref:DUF5666 domain-containing protein n=1 Tax=Pirellula staleyi (strain ATCC 27377 / DSM 6068 / ICPB 4128) TaxID=530564 RepID=D2QYR5_PIRSD|nr:hypothetical protein [Pirellula staleyi]ADB16370.1 hypothetical protein Psta_1695 [Pirellula staleyi DSM 6068]
MSIRMLSVAVLLAGTVFVSPLLGADKEPKPEVADKEAKLTAGDKEAKPTDANAKAKPTTHDGKIVSCSNVKLVMLGKDSKEHSHELNNETLLTLDGKPSKANELKEGTKIRVTISSEDAAVACRVEAIDKLTEYPAISHDGKVVSTTDGKLVMTNLKGAQEHSCMITDDVKITCDGEACKLSDLKPGTKIRVSSESANPETATSIEAIVKNPDFASL